MPTLAIVVLALVVGPGNTQAQNDKRPDRATNSMPNGSKQSQANGLKDETAKIFAPTTMRGRSLMPLR